MIFRRSLFTAAIIVAVTSLLPMVGGMAVQAPALPSEISDKDF
jgi:predicted PurR-regulated permease PerM